MNRRAYWVIGTCWWCDEKKPVMWLGEARTEAESTPAHACAGCIQRLAARIQRHVANQYRISHPA